MNKKIQIAAFVFMAVVLVCPRAGAVDTLVFDITTEEGFPEQWAGPALTDFLIRTINSSEKRKAMPRDDLRRLLNRWPRKSKNLISFDQQESLRKHAGASTIIEGRLSMKSGSFLFTGTYMEPEKNVIEELSFTEKTFNIETFRDNLRQKMEKASGVQNKNGSDVKKVVGTTNAKAYVSFWKSVVMYESGDSGQALPIAEEAAKADQAYIEPRILIGRILLEKTDLNGSAAEFKKVVAAAPEDPRGHFWLGFTNSLLRKNAEAEKSLRKALQLSPGNPDYIYQLGMLFKSSMKYSEAAKSFEKAVAADESIADAWYQLAVIYSITKKEKETFDYLAKAVKWGGKDISVKAGNDADFEWLRGKPKFNIILKSIPR